MALIHLTWALVIMRASRDMLERHSIRAGVTTRRTVMRVRAITAVLAIIMAVRATTMEDQDIRITATIHPGRLPPTGTTRIRTMGVILAVTLTTSLGMDTTLQRLQRYNAAWVSSATIKAQLMELSGHKLGQRSLVLRALMGWLWMV